MSDIQTSTLTAAREYIARGISVIPLYGPDEPTGEPVDKRGKRPAIGSWKEYQTRLATDDELVKWFEDGKRNIGIVTGAISGITAVDFDTQEAIEDAKRKNFPRGPLSKTAKGYHALCRYEAGHRNFQKRADLPGIDLRAEGGYIVAGPSIHATGKAYAWVDGRGLDTELPTAPEWLFAKSDKDKTPISDLYNAKTGNRNESLARLLGSWLNDHKNITLPELADMAALWNKSLPSPLSADEINRTCESIFSMYLKGKTEPANNKLREVTLIQGCTVQPEHITWAWNGWFPLGKLVIVAGQPGTGKTTVMLAIATAITIGGNMPDGTPTDKGSVVIWSGEDGLADTLAPRLIAMGADMTKIFFVAGKGNTTFDPSQDMPLLAEIIKTVPDIKMVVIDPVVSAISGDSHKNAEVRKGLQPLVDLGRDTGACIVGISHFNKSGGNTSTPLDLISGSIAFGAIARVVIGAAKLTAPDPEHGHSRILCRIKSNIGPDEDGVGYDLRMEPLEGRPDMEASTVLWGQYVIGHSRDLLSQAQSDDGDKPNNRTSEAEDFLSGILAAGEVAQKTIEEESEKAGIADKTLRRAKKKLRVISKKTFAGWVWRLPAADESAFIIGSVEDAIADDESRRSNSTWPKSTTKKHDRLGRLDHLEDAILVNMVKMPNMANEKRDENMATLNLTTLPNFDF